jgi:hypothetical protein
LDSRDSNTKKIGPGCVVCLANDLRPIDKKNQCIPVWLI